MGTYTSLNYHVIFSTKERAPLLEAQLRPRIYTYLGGIIRDLGGQPILIGGVEDHVHVLCRLGTAVSLADALRQVKGSSSRWINEDLKLKFKFQWQSGYSAFTVSRSNLGSVETYIAGQEEHHRKRTFKEEVLEFLRVHEVEYDERYLWD